VVIVCIYVNLTQSLLLLYYLSLLFSGAYEGGVSREECLVENSEACAEYHEKLLELAAIIEASAAPQGWLKKRVVQQVAPNKECLKSLVEDIQTIRLTSPDVKAGADSPAMCQAMQAAKEVMEEFGANLTQARLAWEMVEEIGAAQNYENATHCFQSVSRCTLFAMFLIKATHSMRSLKG
jgi:hypothetical protein